MNETIKEKRIRLVLIGFFILVTFSAFIFRNDNQHVKTDKFYPIALVLKASYQTSDDPIVALYEFKNNEHLLAIYKIERNNRFRFKTLYITKLDNAPNQLSPDKNEKGIWAQIEGNWQYFSDCLQREKREIQNKVSNIPFEAAYTFNKDTSTVIIHGEHPIKLNHRSESPIGIYSLSNDGLLWLIVTQISFYIGTVET